MPKPTVAMTARVLLVVKDVPSRNNPGAGWMTRVVQWVKDGKGVSVKVEVGEYWKHKDTGETFFKTKGLTLLDFKTISEKWREIKPLMENPPAVPVEETVDPLDKPDEFEPGF
jgi:hypothetical protein